MFLNIPVGVPVFDKPLEFRDYRIVTAASVFKGAVEVVYFAAAVNA